ncbi:hypothetical protein [Bradyrhizobium sp. BR 1432]|uniref:hypothetical protein n=1 Tax=Bradyrhizobium sp. BR 1432 TaxID=3447966 RepID=UPI003EE7FD9E
MLAVDGVFDTGLAAVLDTLATANELAMAQNMLSSRFDVRVVGTRRNIRTSLGLLVPAERVSSVDRPDWVVVPALGTKMPEPLVQALARGRSLTPPINCAIGMMEVRASLQLALGAFCSLNPGC